MPKIKSKVSSIASGLKRRIKELEWTIQRQWTVECALIEQLEALGGKLYLLPKSPFPKCPVKKLDMIAKKAILFRVNHNAVIRTLEKISKKFPTGSREARAIQLSARALILLEHESESPYRNGSLRRRKVRKS